MAVFAQGNVQKKIDFFNNTIKQLPTDKEVKSGLAFDSNALQLMQAAIDDGNLARFEQIYDAQDRNWEDSIELAQRRLEDESIAIANLTDENADAEDAGSVQEKRARVEELTQQLQRFGELLGQDFVPNVDMIRTRSGFQRGDEVFGNATPKQRGNTGEPLIIRTNDDGSFRVEGTVTGQVYEDNIPTMPQAQAFQLELNAGFVEPQFKETPQAGTGTPSAGVATGGDSAGEIAGALEESVTSAEEEFTAANPGELVTPEMRAEWLKMAYDELKQNGYYNELIRNYEMDTQTSFDRFIEDVRVNEAALARQYREGVRNLQSDLQNRGMLYGGVRGREEAELAEAANVQAEALGRQFERGLEDRSREAERALGTEAAEDIAAELGQARGVGRFEAGTPEMTQGEVGNIFSIQGGQFGELPREQEAEALRRAQELEDAFTERFSVTT